MGLRVNKKGQIVIVELEGKIDVESAPAVDAKVNGLIDAGEKYLVFDFGAVTIAFSPLVRLILKAGRKVKAADGKMLLAAMSPTCRHVFDVAGISALFDVFPSQEAAVASLEMMTDWD